MWRSVAAHDPSHQGRSKALAGNQDLDAAHSASVVLFWSIYQATQTFAGLIGFWNRRRLIKLFQVPDALLLPIATLQIIAHHNFLFVSNSNSVPIDKPCPSPLNPICSPQLLTTNPILHSTCMRWECPGGMCGIGWHLSFCAWLTSLR